MGDIPIVTANKLSLLELVGQAASEIGIRAPTSLFNNPDPQALQLLALAQREGKDFYQVGHRRGGWQALRKQKIFNMTAPDTTHTATLTLNSATLTAVSPADMLGVTTVPPPAVSGDGIPQDARLVSVTASTITMDSYVTTAGTAVDITLSVDTYSLPDDFQYFQQATWWDREYHWQVVGPLTSQEWQILKSGISPVGPRRYFRIVGNYIFLHPAPTAAGELSFEYQSNGWCQSSAGTVQSVWADDDDYYSLDDDAFILGLKWRFKAAKGFDYTQEKIDYDRTVERLIGRDGGNKSLSMNAQARDVYLLNINNVPDTGYGS